MKFLYNFYIIIHLLFKVRKILVQMSTESDENREIDIKIEIQKTLISINNTTLKM